MTLLRALGPTVAGTPGADCCVAVQTWLERAYGLEPARGETLALWRLHEPLTGERAWGPVVAAAEVGIAEATWRPPTVADPPRGARCVVQGWRTDPLDGVGPDSGHTFLWFACASGYGVQLDSTRGAGVRAEWRRWADVVREFRHGVAVAVLRRLRE